MDQLADKDRSARAKVTRIGRKIEDTDKRLGGEKV